MNDESNKTPVLNLMRMAYSSLLRDEGLENLAEQVTLRIIMVHPETAEHIYAELDANPGQSMPWPPQRGVTMEHWLNETTIILKNRFVFILDVPPQPARVAVLF